MKRSGLTTIIAMIAIGFFMMACSEQKPTAEKTTQESTKVKRYIPTPEEIESEAKGQTKPQITYTDEQLEQIQQEISSGRMAQFNQEQADLTKQQATMDEENKAKLASEMKDLKDKVNWEK
jgi:hypothetical protein